MKAYKNLVGAKFGKLLVIEPGEDHVTPSGTIIRRWVCRCDCGKIKVVRAASLINGHTKSCGCAKGRKPEEDKIEACVFFPATIDCTKLECEKYSPSKRISEMRLSGYNVDFVVEKRTNAAGKEVRYKRYFISEPVRGEAR